MNIVISSTILYKGSDIDCCSSLIFLPRWNGFKCDKSNDYGFIDFTGLTSWSSSVDMEIIRICVGVDVVVESLLSDV